MPPSSASENRSPSQPGNRHALFTQRVTRRVAAGAMATVLLLSIAGCGGKSDQAAEYSDADRNFLQAMIPHHEQAILMSDLAPERAGKVEVKALAARIETAQAPEIEEMKSVLKTAGEDHHADQEHMHDDGTMLTNDEMEKLRNSKGADFDRAYLQGMIKHHQGAVSMAQTEIKEGKSVKVVEMASKMTAAQKNEIDEMKKLLESVK